MRVPQSVTLNMINAKVAAPVTFKSNKDMSTSKYFLTVEYPYLFPTIESIEEGKVPSSLWELNIVKNNVPLDLLLPQYQYQNINSKMT